MNSGKRGIWWGILGLGALLLLAAVWRIRPIIFPNQPPGREPITPTVLPTLTPTREPIIPTPTATPDPNSGAPTTPTAAPLSPTAAAPSPTPFPATATTPAINRETPSSEAIPYAQRFGAAGPSQVVQAAQTAGLPIGTYLDWHFNSAPVEPPGITYWQMVRLTEAGLVESWDALADAVRARPGSVWIVGNEPDVTWQDNVTASRYAELYHAVYTAIKGLDATAQIASAGVSQSTPLRRAYLDAVLDTYQARYGEKMPVDIWTVHAFTLREQANSWGVGIPPGMNNTQGELYEIVDHDNMDYFRQNLLDFRAWMAARGYRDRPLAVTEFGILLPNDYGFPPEAVAAYLTRTFDFLLTAANETGYPADGNRLAQWWFWYSIEDLPSYYPTGDLYNSRLNTLTQVGEAFQEFYHNHQPQP